MNRKEQKLLVETAALAGELMLSSGAETFRAEDTMAHILKKGTTAKVTPVALITSIMVTLEDPEHEPLSVIRRVRAGSLKLNRIVRINEISRNFCDDKISLQEAFRQLNNLKNNEYPSYLYFIATIGVCLGFSLYFGGGLHEMIASVIVGTLQALLVHIGKKYQLQGFIMNCVTCAGMAFLCEFLNRSVLTDINTDIVIISCIMTMVPGVAITNAIRDTLQGDYLSGSARTMEAFLKAASVSIGVGIGQLLFRLF